jgi:hypothetical protein
VIRRKWLPLAYAAASSLTGAVAAFGVFWLHVASGAYDGGYFGALTVAAEDMLITVGIGAVIGLVGGYLVGRHLTTRPD